jgi:hypothetical protein
MNIFFLAARVVDPFDESLPRVKAVGSTFKEWMPVLGAILLVSTIVILWVVFSSRSRRHRARREERRQRRLALARNAAGLENASKEKDHHGRRRRRHHRPRNPTLAETGGLPPIRGDDQPPQIQPH